MKFGTVTCLTTVISFGVLSMPARLPAHSSSGIITFDAPGAIPVAGSFDGTVPESINEAEAITGHYIDAQGLNHGFLRIP